MTGNSPRERAVYVARLALGGIPIDRDRVAPETARWALDCLHLEARRARRRGVRVDEQAASAELEAMAAR